MPALHLDETSMHLGDERLLTVGDRLADLPRAHCAHIEARLIRLSARRGVSYTATLHTLLSVAVLRTLSASTTGVTRLRASALRGVVGMKCEALRAHVNRRRGRSDQLVVRTDSAEEWLVDYRPPATFACTLTDAWHTDLSRRLEQAHAAGPAIVQDTLDAIGQIYLAPLERICAASPDMRPRLDIIGCTGDHSMLTIAFGARSLMKLSAETLRGFDCRLLVGRAAPDGGFLEQFASMLAARECTLEIRRLTAIPANVGHAIGALDRYAVVRLMFNPRPSGARRAGPRQYLSFDDPDSAAHAWFSSWFAHYWTDAEPLLCLPHRLATSELGSDVALPRPDSPDGKSDVIRVDESETIRSPITVESAR